MLGTEIKSWPLLKILVPQLSTKSPTTKKLSFCGGITTNNACVWSADQDGAREIETAHPNIVSMIGELVGESASPAWAQLMVSFWLKDNYSIPLYVTNPGLKGGFNKEKYLQKTGKVLLRKLCTIAWDNVRLFSDWFNRTTGPGHTLCLEMECSPRIPNGCPVWTLSWRRKKGNQSSKNLRLGLNRVVLVNCKARVAG